MIKAKSHAPQIDNCKLKYTLFYRQHQAEIGEDGTKYDMLVCIMQQLNNVWSSSHEQVKQYWVWEEEKKRYL